MTLLRCKQWETADYCGQLQHKLRSSGARRLPDKNTYSTVQETSLCAKVSALSGPRLQQTYKISGLEPMETMLLYYLEMMCTTLKCQSPVHPSELQNREIGSFLRPAQSEPSGMARLCAKTGCGRVLPRLPQGKRPDSGCPHATSALSFHVFSSDQNRL